MSSSGASAVLRGLTTNDIVVVSIIAVVVFFAAAGACWDAMWTVTPIFCAAAIWPFPLVASARWRDRISQSQYFEISLCLFLEAGIGAFVAAFATSRSGDFSWAALILATSGALHLLLDSRTGTPGPLM